MKRDDPSFSSSSSALPRREALRLTVAAGTLLSLGATQPARAAEAPARRALVLSGGGAHGAYEAGVIAGLVQSGALDSYDVICGTSIGSLNAAMIATGQGAGVRQLWSTLAKSDILRPKRQFAAFDRKSSAVARGVAALRFLYGASRGTVTGFIDPAPLHDLITSSIMLPSGAARPFHRPLLFTATDLSSACGIGFMREAASAVPGRSLPTFADLAPSGAGAVPVARIDDRNLVAALQASAAIPGVFDPVALTGRSGALVDGGVLNNAPLDLAQFAGATQIDTVLLVRPVAGRPAFRNATAIVEESFGIMRQGILDDALALSVLSSDPAVRVAIRDAISRSPLREQVPKKYHELFREDRAPVNVRVLAPSQELFGSGFVANDQSMLDKNLELGYADFTKTGFQPISTPLGACRTS